ncbi:MAG TPA: hypothetical protein DCK99_05135 [Blastocatellia bacterium]|nr:hypothetical protein [Blastocatellia bacterium]
MPTRTPSDLQKSAEQLVAEMEQLIGGSVGNPAFNTRLATQALHKFACVLTVVSLAADKHSRRLVRLTWALLIFTVALLLFTIFLYQDAHTLTKREQASIPNSAEHP